MEILRYSRDTYGQQVLQGVSWDLLWVFAGISALIIAGHLIYMWLRKPGKKSP